MCDSNKVSYEKCEGCRFCTINTVRAGYGSYVSVECEITGKHTEIHNCIKIQDKESK